MEKLLSCQAACHIKPLRSEAGWPLLDWESKDKQLLAVWWVNGTGRAAGVGDWQHPCVFSHGWCNCEPLTKGGWIGTCVPQNNCVPVASLTAIPVSVAAGWTGFSVVPTPPKNMWLLTKPPFPVAMGLLVGFWLQGGCIFWCLPTVTQSKSLCCSCCGSFVERFHSWDRSKETGCRLMDFKEVSEASPFWIIKSFKICDYPFILHTLQ